MSTKTNLVSTPSSSSLGEASADFDTLSSTSEHSDSFDLEDVGYKQLLEEFPVGLWIWKYDESFDSVRLAYMNSIGKDPRDIIGKLFHEIFPHLTHMIELYKSVIKTGKEIQMDEWPSGDQILKLKLVRIGKDSCGVLWEDVSDIRSAQKRRDADKQKVESILEKAIDIMTSEMTVNSGELSWMSSALRSLLTYFDESQSKVLVQEKVNSSTSQISIADVMTLINNLSEHSDESYLNQFLISFRYFIAPSILFKKLVLRYVNAENKSPSEKIKIHQRTLKVIKTWIKSHFYDFQNDPELLGTLQNFITNTVIPQSVEDGEALKKSLNKRLHFERRLSDSMTTSTRGKSMKSVDLLTIDPIILANHLTVISFEIFKHIKPVELYFQAWSKEDKLLSAPNVTSIISNFNKLTSWIISEIVTCGVLKKRASILKHFILVAWAAYGYRDFETLFTIQIALSMHSISRLCDTWKYLDTKTRQQWYIINNFASYDGNYKGYRRKLKNIFRSGKSPNVLPYMGIYLRDLAALEEGSGNFDKEGAVNFHKMRMVASIIAEIQIAQNSVFNFPKNFEIISKLSGGLIVLDEERVYELSKKCEPSPEPLPSNYFTDKGTNIERILKFSSSLQDGVELVVQNPIFGLKIPNKNAH